MQLTLLLLMTALVAACGPGPLTSNRPTSEALARDVLSAFQARDRNRLESMALTTDEFKSRVWPSLPAARPERNVPWEYVWTELQQKSRGTLERTLSEHGGQRYELEAVRFSGNSTDHGAYRVHRGSVLVVRDASGQTLDLRLFGSMIEGREGWKVFSYVVDR